MSTDLELCQDLPKIRLSSPLIKIETPEPSAAPAAAVARRITIQRRGGRRDTEEKKEAGEDQEEEEEDEEEECRTPTSERHRIPPILSCPPAPRKPARRVPSCKRKLTELQFFEVKNREEVEEYFRSSFKRSCCPCK